MSNLIPKVIEVTVKPDLNTIIKYHPASKIYLDINKEEEYSATFRLKLMVSEIDGEHIPIADYKYAEIVARTLPDSKHENDLLVLVRNMLELEWAYFETYYVLDENKEQYINLHTKVTAILEELKVLHTMREANNVGKIYGQLDLTENKDFGKINKQYIVPGIQLGFSSKQDITAVIDILANNRLKELATPEYYFFDFHEELSDCTPEKIQAAIDRMKQPFREFRAKWLFRKYVAETILNFIKGEMNFNQGDVLITENQGVLIHTLFCLFNLIDPEQEMKNVTARLKAKYIRTLFRRDLQNNDEQFVKIEDIQNYTKIKLNDNQWFRLTRN